MRDTATECIAESTDVLIRPDSAAGPLPRHLLRRDLSHASPSDADVRLSCSMANKDQSPIKMKRHNSKCMRNSDQVNAQYQWKTLHNNNKLIKRQLRSPPDEAFTSTSCQMTSVISNKMDRIGNRELNHIIFVISG